MDELLSCPFCGHQAALEPMKVRKGYEAVAHCNGCLASIYTITYESEEDAISNVTTSWNRRVFM